MAQLVDITRGLTLDDYSAVGSLAHAVADLRAAASEIAPRLAGRTVWMVNSTPTGGGVAEMLPTVVSLLDELGVTTRWVVIESDRPEFFVLTKRIHNMIHGVREPKLLAADRTLYDQVSRANADALGELVARDDVLVIHDPQPLGAGALLVRELGVRGIWRCHIGLDEHLAATREAWGFLEPYTAPYHRAIFSSEAYVPDFLRDRSIVAYPTVDPLDHKNRELSLYKLVGILCSAGLVTAHWPLVRPPFPELPQRLQVDGTFAPGTVPEDFGLIGRPIVTQVSRWDRLKGFAPLLEAFRVLKLRARDALSDRHRRQIDAARLVLAGPSPESIQDDPEALGVLDELCAQYVALEPEVQRDVAVLTLPMSSRKFNALIVNALQRASSIVVQNSLREGFGLTATEAMWKSIPVIGNTRAVGLREQIRDGIDGRLVADPEDPDALADALDELLSDPEERERFGHNAHRRVREEFLIFTQLRQWLQLLGEVAEDRSANARSVARAG